MEQVPAEMSKSLKNVVNPDDVVNNTVPIIFVSMEMFMGPLDASTLGLKKDWKEAVIPRLCLLFDYKKRCGKQWRF